MLIFYAILLGLLFGFVLQKSGAANPEKIINMLRLKDFHLMKVIFFAIGMSSLILFILLATGLIQPSHISIKSAYVGVVVGGGLLGLGWMVSGFCPGTGLVAAGYGRKDALFFILGGLLGAALFMGIYGALKSTALFQDLGGKVTLAATGVEKYPALISSVPGLVIAGVIAIFFCFIAWKLPVNSSLSNS